MADINAAQCIRKHATANKYQREVKGLLLDLAMYVSSDGSVDAIEAELEAKQNTIRKAAERAKAEVRATNPYMAPVDYVVPRNVNVVVGPDAEPTTVAPANTPGNAAMRRIVAWRTEALAQATAEYHDAMRQAEQAYRDAHRQAGLGAVPETDATLRESLPIDADLLLRLLPEAFRSTLAGIAAYLPDNPSERWRTDPEVWEAERVRLSDARALLRRIGA